MKERFKVGQIVKLSKFYNAEGERADRFRKMLYEILKAGGCVACETNPEYCSASDDCRGNIGVTLILTEPYGAICSKSVEAATDRETFLYHVAGLRERIE